MGGVLDARERLVDGEHVGDVLRALRPEIVEHEAANGGRAVSALTVVPKAAAFVAACALEARQPNRHLRNGVQGGGVRGGVERGAESVGELRTRWDWHHLEL